VVWEGVSEMLVPFGDAGALARGVEELMRDLSRRAAIRQAGRRRARERFLGQAIVPVYEKLYRDSGR
jgi:glycosyltransferase involved in cell wall biosynthesis